MTDTSLPSQPSSISAAPSVDPASYVDSYAPPSMSAAPSVPASASPVADTPAVPPAQAPAPTSPTAASDPLAELEKALEEYEARQKELAVQAAPQAPASSVPAEPTAPVASSPAVSTPSPVASSTTPDPLAELEKALNEYESRQKALADQKQEVVQEAQQVAQQADGEDPLVELERVLDEYESKYKQEADSNEPASTPAPAPNTAGLADQPSEDAPLTQPQLNSVLKDEPVQSAAPAPASTSSASVPASNEAIEEQNIFELLGVTNAQAAEKEAFLDELQEALWDDFLDKDLALLVTPEQLKEVQDLRAQSQLPENERQEKLIAKVESLVPDIEEIMLEKALELKEDMVRERISGLKEYYAQKPDELAKVHEAEQLAAAGRWKSVASLLNSLTV